MQPRTVGTVLLVALIAVVGVVLYDPIMDLVFTDRDGMDHLGE